MQHFVCLVKIDLGVSEGHIRCTTKLADGGAVRTQRILQHRAAGRALLEGQTICVVETISLICIDSRVVGRLFSHYRP